MGKSENVVAINMERNTIEKRKTTKNVTSVSDDLERELQNEFENNNATSSSVPESTNTPSPLSNGNKSGVIQKIVLQNFMSHRHLKMNFISSINFICGPNGSGKSAILVAISVALGAKMNFNNRGTNVSSLIRTGEDYGFVQLTLSNSGDDPYKPEIFGESVIVERHLYRRRSSPSSYKIRSSLTGKVVYSTRKQLEPILDAFNIHIDNPCVVLMQDAAREFIAKSKSSDKYKFFLQATQLDKIRDNFKEANVALEDARLIENSKNSALPYLKEELRICKEQVEAVRKKESMEEMVRVTENELLWLDVQEKEKDVSEIEKTMCDMKNLEEDLTNKIKVEKETEKELKGLVQKAEEEQRDADREADKVRGVLAELSQEDAQSRREMRVLNGQGKALKQRKENVLKRIERCDKEIQESRERNASSANQREQDIVENRKKLEHHCAEIQDDMAEIRDQIVEMEQKTEQTDDQVEKYDHTLGQRQHERSRVHRELQRMQSQSSNRASAFGPGMPKLLSLIHQNQRRFRKLPLLIGMHIKVKDARYSLAIESCLGGVMSAFAVDNHDQDEPLLKSLANQARVRCSMIVSPFGSSYQVPRDQRSSFPKVLDLLEVSAAPVFNALVDQCRIDQNVIVSDKRDAYRIIRSQRGISNVFLLNGDRIFNRNGTEVHDSCRLRSATKLVESVDAQIREAGARLQQLDQEIQPLKGKLQEARNVAAQARRDLNKVKLRLRDRERALKRAKEEMRDLDEQEKEVTENTDLIEMVAAREQLDASLRACEEEISKHEQAFREAMEVKRERKIKAVEVNRMAKAKLEKLTEKQEASSLALGNLRQCTNRIAGRQNALSKVQSTLKLHEKDLQAANQEVESSLKRAQEVHPERMEPSGTKKALLTKLKLLKQQLAENQDQYEPIAVVTNRYIQKKRNLNRILEQLDNSKKNRVNLNSDIYNRFAKWNLTLHSLAQRTTSYFNVNLSKRGASGQITFDHRKKTLDVSVQMRRAGNASQTTKSLSGGERSFSTVALLLSLWQAMDNPFRALDEFDVFMDAANRKTTISLLMDTAKIDKTQFIFISPQSVADIDVSDKNLVRVVKMHPPREGADTPN